MLAIPAPWDRLDDVNEDLITHGRDKNGAYRYVLLDTPIENADLVLLLRNNLDKIMRALAIAQAVDEVKDSPTVDWVKKRADEILAALKEKAK